MRWMAAAVVSGDQSVLRRLHVLRNILGLPTGGATGIRYVSASSSTSNHRVVSIGDVTAEIKPPKNPELVPIKFHSEDTGQAILKHLRWIMQKDLLGQDMFLIGPPGPLRRNVAMMYLEMTQKEAEYVSLSRDTTESDLKQRREIRSGSAYHIDQCAVRAATHGRVLVLEGIEKAERNVLPVLNNLLENREMQLDDGRFLMAAPRYDKLLKDHSVAELDTWKLVRVHEDFRVIALGLPVPRYLGNPLDPPLRSRFQARDINPLPFKDQLEVLNAIGPNLPSDRITKILSFAMTMISAETFSLGLPDFPMDSLPAIVHIMNACPSTPLSSLIERLYPYQCMLGKEGQGAVKNALKMFELLEQDAVNIPSSVIQVRRQVGGGTGTALNGNMASVQLQVCHQLCEFQVPAGTVDVTATNGLSSVDNTFIATPLHNQLLADMIQSHMVKDFCLIGPRGCGKSALVKQFADLLGYHIEPIMLYQDMTARDLLQQRQTSQTGDTSWRLSPLVIAARDGGLAVLDGVHRVNAGTFAVLQRLVQDRELTLFDGTRMLRHDRYEAMKQSNNFSDQQMMEKGILRIHPSFRVVALSEPPVIGGGGAGGVEGGGARTSSAQPWLTAEQLTMFLYHQMRSMSKAEEMHVLTSLVPNLSNIQKVMDLTHKLREAPDSNLMSISASLSTRQLIRIAHRLSRYPDDNLYEIIQKACLARFLPRLTRTALEEELDSQGIVKPSPGVMRSVEKLDRAITCEIRDGILRIGNTQVPIFNTETKMKVPDVLFYENTQHLAVMEDMLKDYLLGEHLLLVGNQGVGKNKIIDRFLFLLNRPREYLQLHRDTTVQTLTLQPTVSDGVIRYEDSPLVRAVKLGHILVVDEADKAPTNVTCIIKTLVESGEMHLADGRRIVSAGSGISPSPSVIVTHPDFRMFVLANRPGFPFLGNDFFGAMGDIFSCHAVDNPDTESEMSMLHQYGPDVPEETLRRLVLAFSELRGLADQGLISYPYSTREVVNMVKHLQKFPGEGLVNVVRNVFDFDSYNKELKEQIIETLHKHGIPVGANPRSVTLAKEFPLPAMKLSGRWLADSSSSSGGQRTKLFTCSIEEKMFRVKGPIQMNVSSFSSGRVDARSTQFSEMEAFWTLPLHETSAIVDVAVTRGTSRERGKGRIHGDVIHVATTSPISLYSMDIRKQHVTCTDLYDILPGISSRNMQHRPRLILAPLAFPLDSTVIVHEELSNVTLSVNWETGELLRLEFGSGGAVAQKITRNFRSQQGVFRMANQLSQNIADGRLLFYKQDGNSIDIVNMLEGKCWTVAVPINVNSIFVASSGAWLLTETTTNKKYLLESSADDNWLTSCNLRPIEESEIGIGRVDMQATQPLTDNLLSAVIGQNIKSPNRVFSTPDSYAAVAVGFPECLSADVYKSPRAVEDPGQPPLYKSEVVEARGGCGIAYLPTSGQVVRILQNRQVPKRVLPEGANLKDVSGFIEVCDIVNHSLRYIPIPSTSNTRVYNQWYYAGFGASAGVLLAEMSNDGLVTVDSGGGVRLWETNLFNLSKSLRQWTALMGEDVTQEKPLQVTYDTELGKIPDGPKHGQVDPTGAPHVGGSNFAGGTGGMNTAGLGGVGGPYRLDGGNAVFQVADWEKAAVPEEVRKAAREMAERALKERLKQIKMSKYDAELYERFATSVRAQIKSLRVILDSLQAKGKERQWLKNQSYGDLDDAKLIEGLTGERSIYKRRGEKEPEPGSPQQKPKLIKLLCDVSGSMYRFNGQDGRLDRQLESILMVMEAFEGYEQKIKYDVMGHSGDGYSFKFLTSDKPPKNNKDRLDTILALHAHSQFCISGDHTLEAAKFAIETIVNEEADEHFVIVLSDANLERYGIRPKKLAEILTSNEDVNAYVIFIGSLGDQAQRIMKQMPSGRAFVCLDTKTLPSILQQIFTSTMLSTF